MAKISQIDWHIVDSRVRQTKEDYGLPTASIAFLWLVLDQFFPGSVDERIERITDGPDDRGVDAIQIIETDDFAEIYIFQSKYRDTIETTSKTINDQEVIKIALFIEQLFDRADQLDTSGNIRLREAVRQIWLLHERGVLCRYRVVLCSNDQSLSSSAQGILDQICSKHQQIHYEKYDAHDFIADLGSHGMRRETGQLQVIGKEVFERTDGDIRGMIASIDARSFVELIQTPDGKSVKRYLFDDNLRVFLGANGGYNTAIINTATSRDSHLFWYLNNGITITCRNYSYNKGHSNPKIKIEDFQIVNGAQTSHSLIEANRINPEGLENVVLLVRIYATDRSDIAERVAVATNSQARIQSRDLRANDSVLKKMELAFKERGYFFERKRNMHSDQEAHARIDALKMGQIILAYYLREPDRARAESDSIFDQRFASIFHEQYNFDEICRLFQLYRVLEQMREDHLTKNSPAEVGSEMQYLAYGHWFILFTISLMLSKNDRPIPTDMVEINSLILDAVNIVARACSTQKSTAHYQIFRSPRTKEKIFAEMEGKQANLFDLLTQ